MRSKFSKIALTAGISLALAFTFNCSSDSGGGGHGNTIKKEKISGVSQKGPFQKGSQVTIYELDENLEKTANFSTGTTDGSGNFEVKIKNGKLASPYVILEVNGKYFNEVSGGPTAGTITLKAVADVSGKDRANINVFTHLECDRVLELAKSGMEFGAAKKKAQKEALNALGISEDGIPNSEDIFLFGSSPGDSLLLATSVLLQGNRSPTEVSGLLADIIQSNGTLSSATKSELASGVANVDMARVGENIKTLAPNAKAPSIDDINRIVNVVNIVGSSSSGGYADVSSSSLDGVTASSSSGGGSSSSVPAECASWEGVVAIPATCNAAGSMTLTCTSGLLVTQTQEIPKLECSSSSSVSVSSSSIPVECEEWEWGGTTATCESKGVDTYICISDPTIKRTEEAPQLEWSDWEVSTYATCEAPGVERRTCYNTPDQTRPIAKLPWGDWEVTLKPCAAAGEEKRTCPTESYDDSDRVQTQPIAKLEYDRATRYCSDGTIKLYGTMTDGGGKSYKTVEIGTQTWMAENLNYDIGGIGVCYNNDPDNCATYGRLYHKCVAFALGTSDDGNYIYCDDSDITPKSKGICPDGWHIPDNADWVVLLKFVDPSCSTDGKVCGNAGTKLKATSGWDDYGGRSGNGIDYYGFSALPGGEGNGDWSSGLGNTGKWFGSSGANQVDRIGYRIMSSGNGVSYVPSGNGISIRCVKND